MIMNIFNGVWDESALMIYDSLLNWGIVTYLCVVMIAPIVWLYWPTRSRLAGSPARK